MKKTLYEEPKVAEYWLLISDLHEGSDISPMPKRWTTVNPKTGGNDLKVPNSAQVELNKCWDYMLDHLPPKLKGVILNGDICDGPQKRSIGKGTWTNDLGEQVDAAVVLLKQIEERVGRKLVWAGTQGSEYHVLEDRSLDRAVLDELGGEWDNEIVVEAMKGEYRIHAHHVMNGGYGSWQYRTTGLARDMMLMELNAAEEEYGNIDMVLRGHTHYTVGVNFFPKLGCITPGWQLKSPFAVKKGMINIPKLGYGLLKIFDDLHGEVVVRKWRAVRPCKVVETWHQDDVVEWSKPRKGRKRARTVPT